MLASKKATPSPSQVNTSKYSTPAAPSYISPSLLARFLTHNVTVVKISLISKFTKTDHKVDYDEQITFLISTSGETELKTLEIYNLTFLS